MSSESVLWYFADPMCSWCYGFAPVIDRLRERYKDRLAFVLMMGGLRPGTTEPVSDKFRDDTLGHWRDVFARTGQPFKFEGAMPEGFVYDTEPASRAVTAVHELNAEATFPYFKSLQHAFYAEARDVTRTNVLAALAQQHGLDPAAFTEQFLSERIRQATQAHFQQTARVGVRGFPTLVLQRGAEAALLTHGWQPLDALIPPLEHWLERESPTSD